VGRLDRGFVQMAEMVNSSRLSNGGEVHRTLIAAARIMTR